MKSYRSNILVRAAKVIERNERPDRSITVAALILTRFILKEIPMQEMKIEKPQKIRIRRSNTESLIETKASLKISQTVSFAAIIEQQVVPVYNATWEFKAKNLEQCPRKGDVIIDKKNTEWQVQKVTSITHRQVRQCQTYVEMLDFLPFDSVNLVRAYAGMSQNKTQMTTIWQRAKSNMSTKVAREDIATHRKNKAKNAEHKLRAYTREFMSLQKNDLVELPDGRQYKIVRVRNSQHMHGWSELYLSINKQPISIVSDET